jgi:hypothetical protein
MVEQKTTAATTDSSGWIGKRQEMGSTDEIAEATADENLAERVEFRVPDQSMPPARIAPRQFMLGYPKLMRLLAVKEG